MKNLSELPKDLLIKLIVTVENEMKSCLQKSYQKIYDRQDKLYAGIKYVLPDSVWSNIHHCDFPGCKEVQINAPDYNEGNLNSCNFSDKNCLRVYYCDAHDQLNYIKGIYYDDISPVCKNCIKGKLKKDYIVAEKDLTSVDKNKVRRQLEEDKIRLKRQQNKVPMYYAMSKNELINILFNIGMKTKEWCEEEHCKEMLLIEDIMRKTEILKISYFFKIRNCNFQNCKNFKISGLETYFKYYYNDIKGKLCIDCRDIYYCDEHLSHFPLTVRNKYFCKNCEVKLE